MKHTSLRILLTGFTAGTLLLGCRNTPEPEPPTPTPTPPPVETKTGDKALSDAAAPDVPDAEKVVFDKKELKKRLTPMQYKVVCENGTEPPFRNEYWDNKKDGIYVDIVSGKPLFSSKDKFRSGTGWPSFTRPVDRGEVLDVEDNSLGMIRVEVRSKSGDAHLGHVFDDGPAPTGMRYCINSASLRFVPVEDLEKEGLSEYAKLFEE